MENFDLNAWNAARVAKRANQSLEELMAAYDEERAATIKVLQALPDDAWEKSGDHAALGHVDGGVRGADYRAARAVAFAGDDGVRGSTKDTKDTKERVSRVTSETEFPRRLGYFTRSPLVFQPAQLAMPSSLGLMRVGLLGRARTPRTIWPLVPGLSEHW